MLTFYDSPSEHWGYIQTSNPIEPVFATVRGLRTTNCDNYLGNGLQINTDRAETMAKITGLPTTRGRSQWRSI